MKVPNCPNLHFYTTHLADMLKISCALLCAGESRRFAGGNKLLYQFKGKHIIDWAIETLPRTRFNDSVAVCRPGIIHDICKTSGLHTIINPHPELTISYSVRLATRFLRDSDGIMFMVADQPLLRTDTICNCIDLFLSHPDHIIAPAINGNRGNPVIFPHSLFTDLISLPQHKGGGHIIKKHPELLMLYTLIDEYELWDIDTLQDANWLETH